MPIPMIAAGFDAVSVKALDEWLPGCFEMYKVHVEQEWHDYESREMAGNRTYKPIGAPWCVWIFPHLTNAEYDFFFTTLASGNQSAEVTIFTWNMTSDVYEMYNAVMHVPETEPGTFEWGERKEIRIEFRDLELVV